MHKRILCIHREQYSVLECQVFHSRTHGLVHESLHQHSLIGNRLFLSRQHQKKYEYIQTLMLVHTLSNRLLVR
jgi:hypothetical protein